MRNQFIKHETTLDDVFVLERFVHRDDRGVFTKTFNSDMFQLLELGSESGIGESLCSISPRGVLRGMHFQEHPYGHSKIVSVVSGTILDVIIGIGSNKNAHNKGRVFSVELSGENGKSLYIPDGYAHGFLVLSEEATVVYHTDGGHKPEADTGIHFMSFGFDWPNHTPILSEKDRGLPKFSDIG